MFFITLYFLKPKESERTIIKKTELTMDTVNTKRETHNQAQCG